VAERDVLLEMCRTYNDKLELNSELSLRINMDHPKELFNTLMSSSDYKLINGLACYIWKSFKVREEKLKSLVK